MAKIVKAQGDTFEFSLTSSEKFVVTPEGITVPDAVAAVMETRFAVTIEDAPASEVAPEEQVPVVEEIKEPEVPPAPPVEPISPDASVDSDAQV